MPALLSTTTASPFSASFGRMLALDEDEASDFAFGDFCLCCGDDSKGPYCSSACAAQDMMGEAPALLSNLDSSSGSQCSTPPSSNPVSPFFGAQDPSATAVPISKLDLGHPKAPAKPPLHFDYAYHLDEGHTDAAYNPYSTSFPTAVHLPASDSTISFPDLVAARHGRRRSSGFQAPHQPPSADVLKLRRTPQQMPSQPRRLSSNLLSPLLKPLSLASPVIQPLTAASLHAQTTPTKVQGKPTVIGHEACGRPQCPAHLTQADDLASLNMARRASAPLTQRLVRLSSESDMSEDIEAAPASQRRGRSRVPKPRTTSSDAVRPALKQRAESAHALDASAAPICTHPEDCMATIKAKTAQAPASQARPLRYLFGRATPSQERDPPGSPGLESQVSNLDLGSPTAAHAPDCAFLSSSSEDEGARRRRGREATAGPAGAKEPARGRLAFRSTAEAPRSRSPHRDVRKSRSRHASHRAPRVDR